MLGESGPTGNAGRTRCVLDSGTVRRPQLFFWNWVQAATVFWNWVQAEAVF